MSSVLKIEKYTMPSASLGAPSPLPDLHKNLDAHSAISYDSEQVTEEEARYMGWGRVNGILPYTILNNYNRTKRMKAWKAIVLENEHIRATFLPQLGARLWSLIDLHTGRELLHCNPVFQPCNLALRNAWISGGVEWNIGIIGHTPFTVDSLYAEALTLSDGTPVVRFYQYERVRHLLYRIEAALPEGARQLFVRVRIDNAGLDDTAVYWWSNIAVDEKDDVRVIVPSRKSYRYGYGGKLTKVPVPYSDIFGDISYTKNLPQAMDYFFDLYRPQRPWISALDGSGYGLCQSSTPELKGRKLFVWGMGAGGRRWQEFLSVPGSAYIEIQAGLAHTQLEHLPMPGGSTLSWLETYGPLQADPAIVHGKDWDAAADEVNARLEEGLSSEALGAMHKRMADELDSQKGRMLHFGDGWGRLEQLICADSKTAGSAGKLRSGVLKFCKRRIGKAEAEWLALLNDGALPCPDPLDEPKGYQVNDRWLALLRESIDSGKGRHWYSYYQLGVMLAYRSDGNGAAEAFNKSLEYARSPWALRCLSVLAQLYGTKDEACGYMLEAVSMSSQRNLALEAVSLLVNTGRHAKALEVVDRLPEEVRRIGRMRLLRIEALLGLGRIDEAEELLMKKIELTDVREGEVSLTRLWFRMEAMRKAAREGVPLTDELIAEVTKTMTPPKRLDFRMS